MDLVCDKVISRIISRLEAAPASSCRRQERGEAVKVEGTWGSFAHLLAAYISKKLGRPILYICPHIEDADKAADDLHTWLGHPGQDSICKSRAGCPCHAERIEPLSAWEGEEELADATDETRAERLKLVSRISSLLKTLPTGGRAKRRSSIVTRPSSLGLVIPASIQALCQPIPKPHALEESSLRLEINKAMSPEQVVEWLVENSFERVGQVDLPGQFARRGGIVDIYAPLIS